MSNAAMQMRRMTYSLPKSTPTIVVALGWPARATTGAKLDCLVNKNRRAAGSAVRSSRYGLFLLNAKRLALTRLADQRETEKCNHRESRDHSETGRIGGTISDKCEHHRRERLDHEKRTADAAHQPAVTGWTKQSERDGAARNRQKAIGHPVHDGKDRGQRCRKWHHRQQ